jgi:hypothetical protein
MVVREHPPVRLWQRLGGHVLGIGEHGLAFREQVQQRLKFDVRVHEAQPLCAG